MIIIRSATINDAQAIALVNMVVGRTTYQNFFPERELTPALIEQATTRVRGKIERDVQGKTCTFVAEDTRGEIVGYSTGGPNREGPASYSGELYNIFVLQQYQRQGIGSRLFLHVLDFLLLKGHSSLILWVIPNTPAVHYYQSLNGQKMAERTEYLEHLHLSLPFDCYGWPDLSVLQHRLNSLLK